MNKIKEIEKMLKDETYLKEYIENIDKLNIEVPLKLESNIISKLKLSSKKDHKLETKVYNFKIQDILKIVACTIFAVTMWQFTLSTSLATYIPKNDTVMQERDKIYNKVDKVMQAMNGFFYKSYKYGRRE